MKIYFALLLMLIGTNQIPRHNGTAVGTETSLKHFKATSADDVLFSCSYAYGIGDDDCIPDNFGAFTNNNISVAVVLKKIMEVLNSDSSVAITANFVTYECTFPEPVFKALTKRSDTTRYILYTKKQLDELTRISTNWAAFGIFAHEVGHHLYLHSLSNPKSDSESRERELQADFFSGYVLRKLKATLQESQSAVNAITNHPPDSLEAFCTHPSKKNRLIAIKKGYGYVYSLNSTTSRLLDVNQLRKQLGKEQYFNKSLEFILQKKFNEAIVILNKLQTELNNMSIEPLKYHADYYNNLGFINKEMGDINAGIKNYDKAIQIDATNPDYFINRAEIKEQSPQKVLKAESQEDIKMASEIRRMEKISNGRFQ